MAGPLDDLAEGGALNDHARRVAARMASKISLPPAEAYAAENGELAVEFASPSDGVETGLWVATDEGEVIVGFHTHHDHYVDWDASDEEHIDAAIESMVDIVAERVVVVSWYERGCLVASSSDTPEDAAREFERMTGAGVRGWLRRRRGLRGGFGWIPYDIQLRIRGADLTVRSWLGTHDTGEATRD